MLPGFLKTSPNFHVYNFKTALRVPATDEIVAFCCFELGKLLWHYTHNHDLAQFHLGQSLRLMRQLGTSLEQARLKTAALLAEIMISRRLFTDCIDVLKGELTDSLKFPQLHNKLLFLYAEAQLRLGEFGRALEAVQAGVQFSRSAGAGGVLMECYFRLVKSLVTKHLFFKKSKIAYLLDSLHSND